jgi:hypothetical protein
MKRSIALAIAILTSPVLSSFAGEPVANWKNPIVPPPAPVEELYRAHELQAEFFGTYATRGNRKNKFLGNHAWGGGGAINYFFTRNFGLGLEGTALRATGDNHDVSGQFGLNVIGRLPIGNTGWAPYATAGIGGFITGNNGSQFDKSSELNGQTTRVTVHGNTESILLEGHAGLGIEYRFTKNIGIFTDGRFTFVEKSHNNYGLVRTGVRFAF